MAQVVGLTVEGNGPAASLGEMCWIELASGERRVAEVVGFRESRILLMPLGELEGIGPGQNIIASGHPLSLPVSNAMLGRVVDGLGNPMDAHGPLDSFEQRSLMAPPPDPLRRARVTEPLPMGVRSVDGMITCGRGQRVGIFGGSGVGKSTLLGMFARYTQADMNRDCTNRRTRARGPVISLNVTWVKRA